MAEVGIIELEEFKTAKRILEALAHDAHSKTDDDPQWAQRRDDYRHRRATLAADDRAAVTHVLTVDIAEFRQLPAPHTRL